MTALIPSTNFKAVNLDGYAVTAISGQGYYKLRGWGIWAIHEQAFVHMNTVLDDGTKMPYSLSTKKAIAGAISQGLYAGYGLINTFKI